MHETRMFLTIKKFSHSLLLLRFALGTNQKHSKLATHIYHTLERKFQRRCRVAL